MSVLTIGSGDILNSRAKMISNITSLISDGYLPTASYDLDLGGLSIFDLRDAMNDNFTAFSAQVNGTAAQGTLTIDTQVTADDTMTIGTTVYTFKAGTTTTASQGTLTVDTQPTVGDTFTIGQTPYTFVTDGTAAAEGEIDVGADLADAKTLIVASINGTDHSTANAYVTAAAFSTDDCVLTAIAGGTAGDLIDTTETFDEATNVFDDVTLGTTTAGAQLPAGQVGIGANEAACKLAIVAAINGTDLVNTAHTQVTAAAFSTDDCVLTCRYEGTVGNAIATTETFTAAGSIFDAATLGTTTAGVNGAAITGILTLEGGDSLFSIRDKCNTNFALVDAIVNP